MSKTTRERFCSCAGILRKGLSFMNIAGAVPVRQRIWQNFLSRYGMATIFWGGASLLLMNKGMVMQSSSQDICSFWPGAAQLSPMSALRSFTGCSEHSRNLCAWRMG
jgi:hypothetical protein